MNAFLQSAGIGADAAVAAVCAIAALIILAGVTAFVLRRHRRKHHAGIHRDNHRIGVRDVVRVDERRRLVLIRRDNMEHLLLTGGDCDLVVESFPDRTQAERAAAAIFAAQEDGRLPKPAEALPRLEARERENAYTAKPQPVPQPDRAEARNIALGAASADSRDNRKNQDNRENAPQRPAQREQSAAEAAQPAGRRNAAADSAPQEAENRSARRISPEREAEINARRQETIFAPGQRSPAEGRNGARPQAAVYAPAADAAAESAAAAAPAFGGGNNFAGKGANQPAQPQAGETAERNNIKLMRGANDREANERDNAQFNPMRDAAEQSGAAAAPRPQTAGNGAGPRNAAAEISPAAQPKPDGKGHESQPRQAAGAYTPYLGYMPRIAPRPAFQPARSNNGERPQTAPQQNSRPELNGRDERIFAAAEHEQTASPYAYNRERERGAEAAAAAPAAARRAFNSAAPQRQEEQRSEQPARSAWFEERRKAAGAEGQYGRNEPIRSDRRADERYAPRPGAGSERGAAASVYSPFAEREERRNRGAGPAAFGLNPQNDRNGFSPVMPAEDDDFDKILQDELLRAPNAIKFPAAPKK